MEDKIIETPLTSEEPFTLKAIANAPDQRSDTKKLIGDYMYGRGCSFRDYFTDQAAKMFGVPYAEVTAEQRAEAKKRLFDYLYGRSDANPFKSEIN